MRLLFTVLGALTTLTAVAQQPGQAAGNAAKFADPATAVALPSSGVSSMGQVTVALVVVLLVLFGAAWLMRQFKTFTRSGHAALEVVQGISLGPKERAVLIKVQNRCLLLGVAPGCVNLLMELDAPAGGDDGAAVASPTSSTDIPTDIPTDMNAPSFKALLKRSMGLS